MIKDKAITIPGVGSRLRALREAEGMTLTRLAEEIGIDKSTLSNYETGRNALSIETLDRIATALGHRPEVVLLFCLKQRYPQLQHSKTGTLLEELVNDIAVSGEVGDV